MPRRIDDLARLFKYALSLEADSPAGRANWRGLVILMLLAVLSSLGDLAETIARTIRPEVSFGIDMSQIFWVWVGCFVLCVAMIFWEDHFSQKYLRNPPGGHRPSSSDRPPDA